MSDLGHLSKKTRERAYVLSRNARSIGLLIGDARFNPTYDYISYWLCNDDSYVVLFATPDGYLAEIHAVMDEGERTEFSPFYIKNIRHFLQRLKKLQYEDALIGQEGIDISSLDEPEGEVDLRGYIEGLED